VDQDWLRQLVEKLIAAYGLPSPHTCPSLWPEAGGRGVLLRHPEQDFLSNAESIRFMAPGLSPLLGGYMLITDKAGGYINPAPAPRGSPSSQPQMTRRMTARGPRRTPTECNQTGTGRQIPSASPSWTRRASTSSANASSTYSPIVKVGG
jgi:hypothetical protein